MTVTERRGPDRPFEFGVAVAPLTMRSAALKTEMCPPDEWATLVALLDEARRNGGLTVAQACDYVLLEQWDFDLILRAVP